MGFLNFFRKKPAPLTEAQVDEMVAQALTQQEDPEYYRSLPDKVKKRLVYVLTKRDVSRGTSGFHGFGASGLIGACGWADYMEKDWDGQNLRHMQGVAFRIDRECFPEGAVRLYYLDEDNFPGEENDSILQIIRQCSSGIGNVHTERRVCRGWYDSDEEKERTVLVFDLDADAIHRTVTLNGCQVSTKDVGSYILVLPRCGEFYCVLGEIRDGNMTPLHRDDFCMK